MSIIVDSNKLLYVVKRSSFGVRIDVLDEWIKWLSYVNDDDEKYLSENNKSLKEMSLEELKKGKISLVIVADDASENTKKLFKDKSSYRKINQIYFATKVELGLAIGKAPRAVIGIKDKALSQKIIELVQSKNS